MSDEAFHYLSKLLWRTIDQKIQIGWIGSKIFDESEALHSSPGRWETLRCHPYAFAVDELNKLVESGPTTVSLLNSTK